MRGLFAVCDVIVKQPSSKEGNINSVCPYQFPNLAKDQDQNHIPVWDLQIQKQFH